MQSQFYKKFFEGKRITKQGFGFLGRGFGVVKFLLDCGATVTVTDTKPAGDFIEQVKELESLGYGDASGKLKFIFGEHREEDFINCDFVIQASGVPKDNHYLAIAKANKVPVYQESSLFVKLVRENFKDVKIVGVTGTRGKTTTTFLIYEVLKNYFKVKEPLKQIHLGGNVQGVATLELIKNIKEGDVVVMELDSWILQGFGDLKISPNISVFTSFMPDHMNYYKGDMKEYFLDKANIFLHQKESDTFVTTNVVKAEIDKYLGTVVRVDILDQNNVEKYKTLMIGLHNQVAINLAWKAVKSFGIELEEFKNIVKDFKGVKGRLEFVKEVGGVKIYNDTCATTSDATVAGLNALLENLNDDGKNNCKIVLICGGRDKELDMTNLLNKFLELQKENKLGIIILNDETTTGTKKLLEVKNADILYREINIKSKESLTDALNQAVSDSNPGDAILFSPAFASFGMFKNEYDRGDKFMELVAKL